MLADIDPKELRDRGWRKDGRDLVFPRHPKGWQMVMKIRSRKIREILVREDVGAEGQVIYKPHRGFIKKYAKQSLDSRGFKQVCEVMEDLHDRFALTL